MNHRPKQGLYDPCHPDLTTEFVKAANHSVFQQMVDSNQDTSTFELLKTYLIATHSSQRTNFQHLSRAWDLQRGDDEKLTDFAGQLGNTIREAIDNNTLFSIMGAILMSEKVKTWNSNLYSHLIKTMDNHYTANGIACEAQQYLDRGIKSDNTTLHNTAYYTHRPQRSILENVPIKQKQSLRTSRQPLHQQQTSFTTPHKRDQYQIQTATITQNPPCASTTPGVALAYISSSASRSGSCHSDG